MAHERAKACQLHPRHWANPCVFPKLWKVQPRPLNSCLEGRCLRFLKGSWSQIPLRAGLHVWGLTGFIYGTGPDLACGSQIAGSELSSGNSGEKPTRDCAREDAVLFLWLECLSLIAWHDDVSTAMICSQVAWGRRVARRDCPWLDGDKWCIDFYWLHACLYFGGFIMFLIGCSLQDGWVWGIFGFFAQWGL